jgi:predicted transposase/invertase (TIGR01784 family)
MSKMTYATGLLCGQTYSRQLNQGKQVGARYIDLRAVIFIAISDTMVFKDKVCYKSDHVILDKNSFAHDLQDFSFTFIELPKFKITDINLLTNIIEKCCYFFKHAEKTTEADLPKIIGLDAVIGSAYEEFNQFNWTEEELLHYEQVTKRIMDNKACEDHIIKTAKAEGIKIGEARLLKMMLNNGSSIEEIAGITNLSVGSIQKLLEVE